MQAADRKAMRCNYCFGANPYRTANPWRNSLLRHYPFQQSMTIYFLNYSLVNVYNY